MSNRIDSRFESLASESRTALIPFLTAGDPDPAWTPAIMQALAGAGADLIELGVPFSDPAADGPVIQAASERAIACVEVDYDELRGIESPQLRLL